MKSFRFYASYATEIRKLKSAKERAEAYDALVDYFENEKMPDGLSPRVEMTMRNIAEKVENALCLHAVRAAAGRAGGSKSRGGGRPKKEGEKNKQNKQKSLEKKQAKTSKICENPCPAYTFEAKNDGEKTSKNKQKQALHTSTMNVNIERERTVYRANLCLSTKYLIPTDKYILYIYPSSLEERQRVGIDDGVHIDNIEGMDRMNVENRTCNREDRVMNGEDKTDKDKPIVWYSDGEKTIPFDEADIEYIDDGEANVEAFSEFSKRMGLIDDIACPGSINDCDWRKIARAYERSSWLRETPVAKSEKWIIKNHRSIEGGAYEDRCAARACDAVDELLRKMKEDGEI